MSEPPAAPEPNEHDDQPVDGATLAIISRRIVGLIKEFYGKGPTGAQTYYVDGMVVVMLRGGYLPIEKTLIDSGQSEVVTAQRTAFQDAMRPRFKQVVEEEMRREVTAFLSATHHDPDINAELFVLAPQAASAGEGS